MHIITIFSGNIYVFLGLIFQLILLRWSARYCIVKESRRVIWSNHSLFRQFLFYVLFRWWFIQFHLILVLLVFCVQIRFQWNHEQTVRHDFRGKLNSWTINRITIEMNQTERDRNRNRNKTENGKCEETHEHFSILFLRVLQIQYNNCERREICFCLAVPYNNNNT